MLKRYPGKSGLEVVVAVAINGEKALTFLTEFEKHKHDHPELKAPLVVFLDVNMPIMNGWEFLEEVSVRHDQIMLGPISSCIQHLTMRLTSRVRCNLTV